MIDPFDDAVARLDLDAVAAGYGLERWAAQFELGTAGYRDRMDPDDAANPEAPFNLVTVAIMAAARARVLRRRLPAGGCLHLGGEVRPHTAAFIRLAARVYAARGIRVRLRRGIDTAPIWYSSFAILYEELDGGESFTASHSPYFRGGWKPLDAEGQQLLAEERDLVAEVKTVVAERGSIELARFEGNPGIADDLDVDAAYAGYQRGVVGAEALAAVPESGLHCAVSGLGGSMGRTSAALFRALGIDGAVDPFLSDEHPRYHDLGDVDGENVGSDPGDPRIYRRVGAAERIAGGADLVLLWDPDGDRLKAIARAPAGLAARAGEVGLELEPAGSDACAVYLTPNQLYLALAAYRIDALRERGELGAHDWLIGTSLPTSKSIEELARHEGVRFVQVPVGFKHFGDLCHRIESQLGGDVRYHAVTGETVDLGRRPRALLLCEESGGGLLGGADLLASRNGAHRAVALREKDGMQVALLVMALAARLRGEGRSLPEFYCDVVSRRGIRHLHYRRLDVRLYDESLIGAPLARARERGLARRDRVMAFFRELVEGAAAAGVGAALAARGVELGPVTRATRAGEAVLIEGDAFRFLLRASGTDALLRYYVEAPAAERVESLGRALTALEID